MPSLCCTMQAVEGIGWSGVRVATTTRSISEAAVPASSSALREAWTARSEVASWGPAILRSRIPLRARIHSSDVSTIFARSSFVRMRSGA